MVDPIVAPSKKILIGMEEISAFLNGMSAPTVNRLITLGMPARMVGGKYYAHIDNIEEFFRRLTLAKGQPIDIPDEG